ncbi:hypothetical protein ACH5RR_005376 [Cinchona calisaya]|uniref:DUF4378 domain-containing protein n=1 Tax=Cinchona calisaya TaxID=153742 RepID=A0ABD3AL03_9GENT
MEIARHRRSKSATALEGNFQIQQQRAVRKSVYETRSYSGGITKEDVFTFESGQNSLKRSSGTPIKKLLAEEMAIESETRRRSPSVIARLMGLDGLPSPQHGQKQKRRLLEKHQQRNASLGILQIEQSHEGRSSRMSSVDQQDFKDVYEDMEASHVTNHRFSSRWSANSRHAIPEMVQIQQKFMDAKRLSSNEKLQVSKEFDDTLEILDSNKELLLKYLQQPHSSLSKHLHDMQTDLYSPLYGHVASLEQSNSAKHEGNAKAWKSARDGSYKRDISSHQKREDGLLLQSHNQHSSYNFYKATKSQSNEKDEMEVLPTRIVVLKPNIVKRANAATSVSSPESSHAHLPSLRKRLQYTGSEAEEVLSCKKKSFSNEVSVLKPKSREDREIAKEITKQMREHFRPSGGLRGYAGDESSYDVYETDSSSASEVMILPSRNSFDGNNRIKHSPSGPCESLVGKEAKKRLSERWKMTHKCQSLETTSKCSTLGEMLAVPERETVQEHFDAAMGLDGSSDSSGWDGPLGISSRDGWKDGCIRNSSRTGSLPPSSSGSRSRRTNGRREPHFNYQVKNEKINRGRSKERRGNLSKKGNLLSKDVRSNNRKSHPCHSKGNHGGGSSPGVNCSLIQEDISSCEDQHVKHMMHCQTSHVTDFTGSFVTDVLTNAKPGNLTFSLNPSLDLHPKHTDSVKERDDSSARDQQNANLQEQEPEVELGQSEGASASSKCPGPEPEFSESSKEADHPSPVSVLEVSFAEDVSSSSDCFETVNAELNELRMQLQLLKMESGGYVDAPVISSKNNNIMQQQTVVVFEEKSIVDGDSWESSYIADVLLCSGLEEFDSGTSFASWHSPECPLGPWVFTNLEKKYNGKTTDTQSERRFLFDIINSALLELFQKHVDRCAWVQPMMIGVSKWQKLGLKDYLIKLLANQEHKVNGDRPEYRLDREMNWSGFKDDIDMIIKEIEKMLIDGLIGELVAI